jgi:surface protein
MSLMFADARAFNQPIGKWKTGSATYMNWMFRNAREHKQLKDGQRHEYGRDVSRSDKDGGYEQAAWVQSSDFSLALAVSSFRETKKCLFTF